MAPCPRCCFCFCCIRSCSSAEGPGRVMELDQMDCKQPGLVSRAGARGQDTQVPGPPLPRRLFQDGSDECLGHFLGALLCLDLQRLTKGLLLQHNPQGPQQTAEEPAAAALGHWLRNPLPSGSP